jgi:excisionase family DNA binding protein
MRYLSTKEVAQKVGIGRNTLERWLSSGKLRAPRPLQVGKGNYRYWADADVQRVRKYKLKNYGKGKGLKTPKRRK